MNVHPIVLTEIIRQRQAEARDDARRWRLATGRRRGQHRHPAD
jgi:hypothetical protein